SGFLNRIDLRLRPGADAERLAGRLRAEMPPGILVERPDADLERSGALSRAYRVNLNVLALVALFTGGLLVFSAQALAVVRRRAHFALLRVIGVTRRQLLASLLLEGALLGAAGSTLGVVFGFALAQAAIRVLGADLGSGYFRGISAMLAPTLSAQLICLFL